MSNTNAINKIFINDDLTIKDVSMTALLFNNGLIVSKTLYSILDHYVNILEPVVNNMAVYIHEGTSDYYEYSANLNNQNTVISGQDKFGNVLNNLLNLNSIVFVDGYKLSPSEYIVTEDSITIINKYPNKELNKVIIYASQSLAYFGKVTDDVAWEEHSQTLGLNDYSDLRYMFFLNGQLVTHDKMAYSNSTVKFNFPIRPGIDTLDYYRLPNDTTNLLFAEELGYFSYGPKDNYEVEVPKLYDAIATFSTHIVRLAIDDIRPGFFIKEENGNGCLMIIDEDYETKSVKCVVVTPFSTDSYSSSEYFIQVPEARSILKYVSEFDLNGKLFPEILGTFQRVLLDETYDSIQRLKNIRSINKVDSHNINALINFLGLKLNITNMTLEEKHALLEELTNFYEIVGTKTSYNFYNVTSTNSRIIKVEQLFTPIKDISSGRDPVQRYVTFRTAEELGASYKREYELPVTDYGDVGTLANFEDSLTNMPRSDGILEDPTRPAIFNDTRPVYITHPDGTSELIFKKVRPNPFITKPIMGPNKPTIDYGRVANEKPENFIDYGLVSEEIKGKWIEWFEWDRPANWYPTNHVNVSVEIPAEIDYDTFMSEFKKTFYDISSTVLYIHNVIDVYTFGDDKLWEVGKQPSFGLMTSQLYHEIEYTFTNNPTIKVPIPV